MPNYSKVQFIAWGFIPGPYMAIPGTRSSAAPVSLPCRVTGGWTCWANFSISKRGSRSQGWLLKPPMKSGHRREHLEDLHGAGISLSGGGGRVPVRPAERLGGKRPVRPEYNPGALQQKMGRTVWGATGTGKRPEVPGLGLRFWQRGRQENSRPPHPGPPFPARWAAPCSASRISATKMGK